MRIRRLLFLVVPLALFLGACFDPTGPRIPDNDDGGDDPPDQNALVVNVSGLYL